MVAKKHIATSSKKKASAIGFISDLDCYLFGVGTHHRIYQKLGAHPRTYKGKEGIYLVVWAPHARGVHPADDFNNWNPGTNPMERISESGIWEILNSGMELGKLHKFAVTTQSSRVLYKADLSTFSAEYRPDTASVTADIQDSSQTDSVWIERRTQADVQRLPMGIYEVCLGSWRKRDRPEKDGFYTYTEIARELVAYIEGMGYTHVEFMGVAEHPLDGSQGYQVTGYFAPISRYGTPAEFMYFVNYLHKNSIDAILDWVPAHFPKDAHGLADFNGKPLLEYTGPRKGGHPDWGTRVFNYGKNEVKDFLISNALYWMEQCHVDGLRADAMASVLCLDYGHQEGQQVPNVHGGNQNLEATEFFKHLNIVVQGRNHGALVITEESAVWPRMTERPEQDGLGFTFKWNMRWMRDFLEYMKLDPCSYKCDHHRITFGLIYFTSENYILAFSHDEVVHLKCSMINGMPSLGKDKFSNLKAGYTFIIGHLGKKLLFMGQDFGQLHEWDEKISLDQYLTDEDDHRELRDYVKDLLHLYKRYLSLYHQDNDWNGLQWTNANDDDRSIFDFIRWDKTGKKSLVLIISFTPVEEPDYQVGIPECGRYTPLLDNYGVYKAAEAPCFSSSKSEYDGQPYPFPYPFPAYRTAISRF